MSEADDNPSPGQKPENRELDKPLLKSIAWTGSVKWACQLVTWVFTLVVARILSPDDYGLMAIATIYLGLVIMLSEFGLGKAIVVLRDLEHEQVAQINGLAILFGLAGMAVSWAFAVPVSHLFFDDPEQVKKLTEVVRVLSITFITGSLRTIPFALLEKDLRFKALALTDAGRTLATALTTLTFALLGYGYWALVAGMLMDSFVASALGLSLRRHALAWPRLKAIRSIVQVSWHFVVDVFSFYVYKSADQAIAGKLLGTGPLGAYALANQFAQIPVDKIAAIVARVTPAFFSAVGNNFSSVRRYLLILTQGLALVTYPITIGTALVAEEFVLVILGDKWAAMIIPLQLLSISAAFSGVYALMPRVLWATGNTRFTMWVSFITAIVMAGAFYLGSFWGTAGIATAWIIAYPLTQSPVYWLAFRRIDLSPTVYLKSLWPALSSVLAMTAVLIGFDRMLPAGFSLAYELALKIVLGAGTYSLTILLLHRSTASTTLKTFRQLRNQSAEPVSG
ncbi:MAG: lipopolysaccharide biosynthesis protein [Gammaproteobacteria bacterium]|nr:lipopolysaccharide biosynthesis protein [Gammaproteobacteria bacterium]MDP6617344.1 lipopolysaccharide biosynthesis protein [Gammaproteobacteria bacterium]MDP6694935.1 lipopolysaccharide biosynthesis protein [Gammaproteobacteria bacterium]